MKNEFLNLSDKQKRFGIVGVIVAIMLYIVLSPFFQQGADQTLHSLAEKFGEALQSGESSDQSTPDYRSYELNLDPLDSILVDNMRSEAVNVGVSNRSDEALMQSVSNDAILTDQLPWYYFSPNVAIVSPTSVVQKYQLLEREELNAFAWYQHLGQELLFRDEEPFTGWHGTLDGWYYYIDGVKQFDFVITHAEAKELLQRRNLLVNLVPLTKERKFFLEPTTQYNSMIESYPVNYSILYKNPDKLILTAPPSTEGSYLLTDTTEFVDMPMDVIEEVRTLDGTWLHVNIGYEDLGWIEKDELYSDYVLTYYSERELLDVIETVLLEEMQNISANAGASFINNETMSQVSVNNQTFFPASTQKIYVLAELYYQYSNGTLDPNDYMEMTWEDQVPGAGIIQGYPSGSQFTLDYLVDLVAIYSDNTAANMLIDAVGGGEVITPHMHQLGLYDTYVDGKYYNAREGYFHTTPADAARLFALIYNNHVNGEPWDEMYITKLFLNSHNFLRQFIPYPTTSWNKSGLGDPEQNDVATFVTEFGSYSLAVYTDSPWDYDAVGSQMGYLSLRVHDVFNEIRSQLWITVEDEEIYFETETDLEEDEFAEEVY